MTSARVPGFARSFRYPGWVNAFDLIPDAKQLYATETLFGSWHGRVLLLAKDAAPASVISDLVKREGALAWRHAQRQQGDTGGWRSNEKLERFVKTHLQQNDCLYGSAAAHMLCERPGWSRSLADMHTGDLGAHLVETLRWTVSQMPNLKYIGCLGNDAWRLTVRALGASEFCNAGRRYRDDAQVLSCQYGARSFAVISLYHPAARVSDEVCQNGWRALAAGSH